MDKVSLLTASRLEPSVTISTHSTLIRRFGPTFALTIQLQRILSSISVFVCLQAWFVAYATLIGTLYVSKFLAFQALVATRFSLSHGLAMSTKAVVNIWDSKSVQSLRSKLFYEFAVFILGGGNSMILVLFWPGWIVVGGTSFALWQFLG